MIKQRENLQIFRNMNSFLFIGKQKQAEEHSHHALQISISLEGPFSFSCEGRTNFLFGVIVGPDVKHSLDSKNQKHATFLLDPEHQISRNINQRMLNGYSYCPINLEMISILRKEVTLLDENPNNLNSIESILAPLYDRVEKSYSIDSRIRDVINYIDHKKQKTASRVELSNIAGLSEHRLSHLFKDEIGVPIRRYLLWRRVLDAVFLAIITGSLKDASLQAGFSDSAHFSRSFKTMFGFHPNSIVKRPIMVHQN